MILSFLFASWNPNKYHVLREIPFPKLIRTLLLSTVLCVFVFWLLLLPGVYQLDQRMQEISATTNITLSASMQQSAPAYLIRNPDILFTTSDERGFITITPNDISIKKYGYFGEESYPWSEFESLSSAPLQSFFAPFALFLLPSLLVWTAVLMILTGLLSVLLYTLCAYLVLHVRNLRMTYPDLWKVSLYALIPSMMLFAVSPVLRIGLPLIVIMSLCFVVWLGYSLIGTALFSDKHAPKSAKGKNAGT